MMLSYFETGHVLSRVTFVALFLSIKSVFLSHSGCALTYMRIIDYKSMTCR